MELLIILAVGIAVVGIYLSYKSNKKLLNEELFDINVPVTNPTIDEPVLELVTEEVIEEVKEVESKPKKSVIKSEVAKKRTRNKGKFVGDDESTPDVNEAFKDGKDHPKKPKKTKTPNLKIEK